MATKVVRVGRSVSVLWASYEISEKEQQQAVAALVKQNQDIMPVGMRVFPCDDAVHAAVLAATLGSKS